MNDQRVGDVAPAGAERPRDRRGNATAHAAGGRVLHQHHERKRQRDAGKRLRPEPAEEQAVERDHAADRQQVEDVGRREPQQRRQHGTFEQQFCARARAGGLAAGSDATTGRELAMLWSLMSAPPQGVGAALETMKRPQDRAAASRARLRLTMEAAAPLLLLRPNARATHDF